MELIDSYLLFALVSIVAQHAIIVVVGEKYTYNFWRPVTAIRNADLSKNDATPRETSWLPLGDMPMHPEYPCAHCITSAAVGTIIQKVVGNDVAEITVTSPTAPGVTRKWTRIQRLYRQVSRARIYAGFHYRFSTEVGQEMGRKIAELALTTKLLGATAPQR
jgi:hypothetical protein